MNDDQVIQEKLRAVARLQGKADILRELIGIIASGGNINEVVSELNRQNELLSVELDKIEGSM